MGYSREPGVEGGAAEAVPVSVGWPPPDSVPDGEGDPEPDSVPDGDGDPDPDWLPDGDGEPDCGDGDPDCGDPDCGGGDPDCGELDWGGGLPEPPVGGGGVCGGWLRKIRMAISTASAASSSISNQETKMVSQPARS